MVVVVVMRNDLCINVVGIQLPYNKLDFAILACVMVYSCTQVVMLKVVITGIYNLLQLQQQTIRLSDGKYF